MELRFPLPTRALSVNEKVHWAAARRRLAPWRDEVGWAWLRQTKAERAQIEGLRCRVHVTIPFHVSGPQWEAKPRDPHNYTGTVVKALVDQLVAQGVWPDDNPDWVTVEDPTLVRGSEVIVTLTPEKKVSPARGQNLTAS